ncbi:MAG TPA: hypothetical protein DCW74_02280 [Alteromonas australica]|uniref:Uncharacterized protein n=1 Tax=Alteromonas australica TaxID=589873 RepID=A0A350NZS7_9ALTE|nr:hypothetical protein [Alteromonas australica]|tara:strand:+ start:864 stop:1220 length:357 start_codon:yes stop_codon:yes gene_type:complete
MKINIKPLSVNKAWKGKRFKSDKYKKYEKELLYLLPNKKKIGNLDGPLKISIEFGFSSAASDFDNPIKPLIDILQKKYHFNDNQIYEANIKKVIVDKGDEYLMFDIEQAPQSKTSGTT